VTGLDETVEVEHHAVIVVGAGIAALSTALELGVATVVVDGELGSGSSPWAQGGMAAALDPADSARAHARDTIAVSGGLGDAGVANALAADAPAAIAWLAELGARFDLDDAGSPALGREAGHRARRIVHANGDATGAEVMRALVAAVRARRGIKVLEHLTVLDLAWSAGRVAGVVARRSDGRFLLLTAGAVVLATGGYGHLFARTTNPPEVRGAALAMAARAGITTADAEMVQFHPTALAVDGVGQLPLLTEALRGEGAILVDELGARFMVDEHPDAELAPRDVVARANYRRLQAGHRPALDARAAVGDAFPDRFPTVFALAQRHGLDPRRQPLPVTPAAHYCMGGIATDACGRSDGEGLWVVGEAASSGVHGANRLASNSLVEGVVMGRAAARDIARRARPSSRPATVTVPASVLRAGADDPAALHAVRTLLWNAAGVERSEQGLRCGLAELERLAAQCGDRPGPRTRDALAVAGLVLEAALARTESRGAHFRADHPTSSPSQARRRLWTTEREETVALQVGEAAATSARAVAA
jgi:L-aspartate oxidase